MTDKTRKDGKRPDEQEKEPGAEKEEWVTVRGTSNVTLTKDSRRDPNEQPKLRWKLDQKGSSDVSFWIVCETVPPDGEAKK